MVLDDDDDETPEHRPQSFAWKHPGLLGSDVRDHLIARGLLVPRDGLDTSRGESAWLAQQPYLPIDGIGAREAANPHQRPWHAREGVGR